MQNGEQLPSLTPLHHHSITAGGSHRVELPEIQAILTQVGEYYRCAPSCLHT